MYKVFDSYLRTETWHTDHSNDLQRFNAALAQIVRDPEFNADNMADYFLEKTGAVFQPAIDSRRTAAWAVREFLEVAG